MTHPIPNAALDDRLAFLGLGGSGKTYNAGVAVERLLGNGARVCIIDPLGAWWGLRLKENGKEPSGFDVVIFGGPHGDFGLTENSGALIGETVATMAESCILDLSEMGSDAAERRFMLAFLTALYKYQSKSLLHLIIDEADMWAPQVIFDKEGGAAQLVGKMQNIVRRGRIKGFIPWLITQRPAVLNWGVLSQVTGIVAFTLTSSQDRDAIGNWVKGQADKERWNEIWAMLPELPVGSGLVWVPRRKIFGIEKFPAKKTFDSSRAPRRGERRTARKLKPLNLDKLKERLATVEAEAKANDPGKLRAEIVALKGEKAKFERQIAAVPAAMAKPVVVVARQSKVLLSAVDVAMKFIEELGLLETAGRTEVDRAVASITRYFDDRRRELDTIRKQVAPIAARLKAALANASEGQPTDMRSPEPAAPSPAKASRAVAVKADRSGDVASSGGIITNPMREALASLAWWAAMGHRIPTRAQIAAICGWSPKGSNLRCRLSDLSKAGFVTYHGGGIALTDAGAAAAPVPNTQATLVESIRAVCTGPMRVVFDALVSFRAEGVTEITRQMIADRVGWECGGSNLRCRLSDLSAYEIIEYPSKGTVVLQHWVAESL